jgi:hypothetical protein
VCIRAREGLALDHKTNVGCQDQNEADGPLWQTGKKGAKTLVKLQTWWCNDNDMLAVGRAGDVGGRAT